MQKLRNIAIIAHVDHGKTTLVDKMIVAGHLLRSDSNDTGDLIMDNNDLERERGITILSKNVSVIYKDYKINIIDIHFTDFIPLNSYPEPSPALNQYGASPRFQKTVLIRSGSASAVASSSSLISLYFSS